MNAPLQEELGDGFSNEYQRAVEVSRLESPPDAGRSRAAALRARGLAVAVLLESEHCRYTDAVIGEYVRVLFSGTREEAEGYCNTLPYEELADGVLQIWPFERPITVKEPPSAEEIAVPF